MEFVFNGLDTPDSIRLLELQPASNMSAELYATLKHVRLAADASSLPNITMAPLELYEALSYVWGERNFSATLRLQDGVKMMKITPNLAEALRRLRHTDQPRTLWVDQICVNQNDDQEKAQQVSMMARIYESAKQVLVWLGEETAHTELAISSIQDIAASYGYLAVRNDHDKYWWPSIPVLRNDSTGAQTSLKLAKQNHIDDIYKRTWFTRLWTVQEVVLAKKAVILCGPHNLEWKILGSATTFLRAAQRSPRAPIDHDFLDLVDGAGTINDIRWHYGNINQIQPTMILDNYQHFGAYMSKLRNQSCSNDLDRVYALLGLRPYVFDILEKNGKEIPVKISVDYKKEPFLLYREWAFAMMRTGNANFLLDAGICQRDVTIRQGHRTFYNCDPTLKKGCWVNDGEMDGDGVGHASTIRGHALPEMPAESYIDPQLHDLPSWAPDLSNKSNRMQSFPWTNVFGLDGFAARSKSLEKSLQLVKWDSKEGDIPRVIFVKALVLDEIGSNFAICEWDESQSCTRYKYLRDVIRQASLMMTMCCSDSWPVEDHQSKAFLRTIFADGSGARCQAAVAARNLGDGTSERPRVSYEKIVEMIYFFDNPRDAMAGRPTPDSVEEILSETLEGHNFFISKEKNYMGLAPLMAKDKDVIALIDSVRVPMVLRHSKIDDEREGYVVVGPCYVHGVMYGETSDQEGEYIPLI